MGLESLQRIIDLCKSVEERGLDPFLVSVDDIIAVLRQYFPNWELPDELCLDAEALKHVASVIKSQSEWVKQRSTSLYTDPFLLEEKIRKLSKERIVEIFLKSWHPIVELEQISPRTLIEAIKYWRELLPLSERWLRTEAEMVEAGAITREELVRQRVFSEKNFSDELEKLWKELNERVDENDKIAYWDFIGAETYEETVQRAYLTSFLVSYGYATFEIHPLEEEIYVKPFKKPVSLTNKKNVTSIPISVSIEEWTKWKERKTK